MYITLLHKESQNVKVALVPYWTHPRSNAQVNQGWPIGPAILNYRSRDQPHKRILLLEREQIVLGDSQVYREIVRLAPKFPDLAKIDEIWFANTSILASEGWACFTLMDGRGLVELLSFENGILKMRRNDRPHLGPPRREF
jgi:hypothetical protein